MVIFFPLTNLVDVDVLLTLALVGLPFVKVLLNVLKDVKPPPAPFEKRSSIKLPPKLKPKGFISCVCKALWCGWEWRFLLERSLCEEWSCKSKKQLTLEIVIIKFYVFALPAKRSSNTDPPKNSLNTSSGSLNVKKPKPIS